MVNTTVRVATYSRVSTAHHEQNPEVQVHELRRYCSARAWTTVEEIVDHGYSGGTDNRPGLKRLMRLARTRQIDAVVILKLDRLFRDLKHLITTLDEFQALGVLFVATHDNIDYSSPMGRLMVQIMGALGEFEKGRIRERTMLGLAHARACGKRLGRPRLRREHDVRSLRQDGLSYRAIAKQLGISRGSVARALKTP
jgi:putative DNA-invertase from lambdoid prophage Rac